jgi:hypothetical protein
MASAFYTEQQLITEVLANLGVLAAGQIIDVEDYNYVDEKLQAIIRKLAELEIVYIADTNNIYGAYYSDLADIVAGECCTKFGSTGDDYVQRVNKGLGGVNGVDVGFGAAAKSLRAMRRGRPTSEVLQSEFF